jgi:2-methylcitrate dehydratase PrpD
VNERTASEQISAFVAGFDSSTLSDELVHLVARAFIDTVAVAVAGQHEPAARLALAYASEQGLPERGAASIWATGDTLPPESAALVNGVMGHVLDYDDVNSPLRAHLSIALFPALTALAEQTGATGRQLSVAYVVGHEVACKLALRMVGDHYARGWHSTASVGTLGATAAGAHLLGLPAEQTVSALGLAVAQTAGTRANFGTMAKSFQAGLPGAAALRALGLARLGFTASPAAIDGPEGYLTLYADGADREDIRADLDQLGREPLELETIGIEVKKYPLCYATHRALDGLLDLRRAHSFTLADVDGVEVETNYRGLEPLLYDQPRTGLEGKFSMPYAVAAAIADGDVLLSSFEDAAVQRPQIQAFLPRVRAVEASGPDLPRWAHVVVRLTDGRVLEQRVDALRGGAELPLTDEQLRAKAADCFRSAGAASDPDAFATAVFSWADRPVASVLAAARSSRP